MEHPQVKFSLNKQLDKWAALEFRMEPKKIIYKHIDNFYATHEKTLKKLTTSFGKEWSCAASLFFSATANLFKNHPWPKGKYIGYISMFNLNPRFLKDKTFQVYFKHGAGPIYVTAHELLHFIFYDYATKKHAKLFKDKDTESGLFWDIAEIFNAVILHSERFTKIHKVEKQIAHPEHATHIKKLNGWWDKNHDIDRFIRAIHRTVSVQPKPTKLHL